MQRVQKGTNLADVDIIGFQEYRKIVTTKAVQIDTDFVVDTLEGTFEGKAGDWLAEGVEGERYIIDDAIFRKTYDKLI